MIVKNFFEIADFVSGGKHYFIFEVKGIMKIEIEKTIEENGGYKWSFSIRFGKNAN